MRFPDFGSLTAVVGPAGRVVVPESHDGTDVLARLLEDGEPDPSFGAGGFGPAVYEFDSSIVDGSERILGLIDRPRDERTQTDELSIRRLGSDGSPDPSFGRRGVVTLIGHRAASAKLAIDGSGRILVAEALGPVRPGGAGGTKVVALHADGRIDRSFGDDGTVRVPFAPKSAFELQGFEVRGGRALLSGLYCSAKDKCHRALAMLDLGEPAP